MLQSHVVVIIVIHHYNEDYIVNIMNNIFASLFMRPTFSRTFRYHEEDPPMNLIHKIYPAYHEEDPPSTVSPITIYDVIGDVINAKSFTGTEQIMNLFMYAEGTLDFNERFDLSPSDAGRHETRIGKSISTDGIDKFFTMSSEPSTPLKAAQSVDRVDLASSALPVADPGLKQAQSMDAVNKTGLRRNNYSFEDKWLAHLTSQASDVMDFGDDDSWSQVSYESSVASTADCGPVRNRPVLSSSVLGRRHSAGDKLDLQSASRRGLSHSMILTWLSHKRYVPANEPISEGAADGAGSGSETPTAGGTTGLTGVGLTGTGIPDAGVTNTPITGTGLTAAATAMVNAGDANKGLAGMEDKKKMKINYRELNAYSPSYW